SNIQGNTIAGINFTTSITGTTGVTTGLGVFSGIAVNSGSVDIGTMSANTIGSASDDSSILINNTTTTAVRINGIYVASASATANIQNNIVGGFTTISAATSSHSFIGIAALGVSGNFTIRNNTIGSTTLANSITMGDNNTTTGICTIQGINNGATGTINIDSNTVTNTAVFGTSATISGIVNSGGSTVTMNSNLITNAFITGLGGTSIGCTNSAAATSLSINKNTIRNVSVNNTTGIFTAISNTGAITSTIAIDSNKLGDATGGLITYTVANSGTLTGISNSGGAATSTLSIQNNDIRGVVHSVAGSSAHGYIVNAAVTLSQNISGNTFTNLSVNTTGGDTFISNNVALPASGVQTINSNSIVTGYSKTAAGGTVTVFTTAATSNVSSTITNTGNDFSNITVSGATILTGWSQLDVGLT
ncbi:MAG: beta strand repeat-containing protein, partial [Bacteroidota bacterium]